MNSEQKLLQTLITKLGSDVYGLPFHQIEQIIGLSTGVLSKIEDVCSPLNVSPHIDDHYAEYEGKRSLRL